MERFLGGKLSSKTRDDCHVKVLCFIYVRALKTPYFGKIAQSRLRVILEFLFKTNKQHHFKCIIHSYFV